MNRLLLNKSREIIAKSLGAKIQGRSWVIRKRMELYVGMISAKTRLSQPLVTHHIKAMGDLVTTRYEHPRIYVGLSENFVELANQSELKKIFLGKIQKRIIEEIKSNPGIHPGEILPDRKCRVSISQSLRKLRDANLVRYEKQGVRRKYYPNEA